MTNDPIDTYDREAKALAEHYESVRFEDVHARLLRYIPPTPGLAFDIGAGSGRDAAWFAANGWHVLAVEPAHALREHAGTLHPSPRIVWIDDRLPLLDRLRRRGVEADLIWLSAVLMHLSAPDRRRAFRRLAMLLKPGGRVIVTVRHGPSPPGRPTFNVPEGELEDLALVHGLAVRAVHHSADAAGRSDLSWTAYVIEHPDDGSGALPFIRGVVLQDAKSATYKLALLRAISRIADQSSSLVRYLDDTVELPLGLVALYWLRMFKPLVEEDIPQAPKHRGRRGLGFVRPAFFELGDISPSELRPGAIFGPPRARSIATALADAAVTIVKNPASFLTFPDGRPVFPAGYAGRRTPGRTEQLVIDPDFLWSLGTLAVPPMLWIAMRRVSAFMEPMLVAEWTRMIGQYAERQQRRIDVAAVIAALRWIDPRRETRHVREIVQRLIERGRHVHCVWTGRRLTDPRQVEIDHCFPFAAWPCDDLWNLMPTTPQINGTKRDRLVTADALRRSEDRIADWWRIAYRDLAAPARVVRFQQEARASLPILDPFAGESGGDPATVPAPGLQDAAVPFVHGVKVVPFEDVVGLTDEAILDGMHYHRLRLRQDQQLPEWDGAA